MDDAVAICRAISELIGAQYEVISPGRNYPRMPDSLKWHVRALDLSQFDLTRHARTLSEDESEIICIESRELGNTLDWIEKDYGEDAAMESTEMDLSDFSNAEVRNLFGIHFPIVLEYLRGYERILSNISSKRGVKLQMRYDPQEDMVFFFMTAMIDGKGLDLQAKLDLIKLNEKALKEAQEEIDTYEALMAESFELLGISLEGNSPGQISNG